MKVEKKQSRESVLDKAKKLAISKAVDQYAKSYEEKNRQNSECRGIEVDFYTTRRCCGKCDDKGRA